LYIRVRNASIGCFAGVIASATISRLSHAIATCT
jgi:hypothetical protein